MKRLQLVPLPTHRQDVSWLARRGVLFAARRLRELGVTDPDLPAEIVSAAMDTLTKGERGQHAHTGVQGTLGRLCAAIDKLIDRSAGQTGKAN